MTIIIGNQKGGAGKSTLTLLLANYLTLIKNCKVTVVDMDNQQSIMQKFDKAKILENAEPYEVTSSSLELFPGLQKLLLKNPRELVLIDLPGKLDDEGLFAVFEAAHLVICPFSYDEFSFESTVFFALMFKKINKNSPLVFVPNRLKANVKFETMKEVNEQLERFGKLTPAIPDRIDCQRVTTFQTPLILHTIIAPVFEQIYADYLYGKHEIAG